MNLRIPGQRPSTVSSPVRGEQAAEIKRAVTPQANTDIATLQQVVRDVFSSEKLQTPGTLAANLPPSLKALLAPVPKSTGPRPDPSLVEATVDHVARILADGAVGESELRAVGKARAQIDAVLAIAPHVVNLPPQVRERIDTLLLGPLDRLRGALENAATGVVHDVASRDEAALKERLAFPAPRTATLDPGGVRRSADPPSFAAPERFQVGDLILVPRSSGPATLGVVVGHDADGVRVEVDGPAGFGIKTLSAAQIASANPFRIGDVFTARGVTMHVTGAGPDGTLRILPYDPAHPDHAVIARGGAFAAELAAELVSELAHAPSAQPAPVAVSKDPAHYARAGGNVVGAYFENAIESSALFAERTAAQRAPWTAASVSELLADMHKVACLGAGGDRPYVSGHYSTDAIHPGQVRGEGWPRSNRARAAQYTDAVCQRLGLPTPSDGRIAVRGVDEAHHPVSFVNGMHFYPDGGSLDAYMKSAASILEGLRRTQPPAPGQKAPRAVVDEIADLYHLLANARPFEQVNNSMFMSQVNVLLARHGHTPVPHGWIDHLAHRLPADAFRKVFAAHIAGTLPTPAELGIEKF